MARPDSPRTRAERDAARVRAAEQARAEAARRAARRRGLVGIGVVVGVIVAVVVVVRGAAGEQERKAAATSTSTTTGPAPTTTAEPVPLPPGPAGAAVAGPPPCPPPGGSPERVTLFDQAPPDCLTPGTDYTADVRTSKGVITVDLDEGTSRSAVNTFVFLARHRYYDGLPFTVVRRGAWAEVGDAADTAGRPSPGFRQPAAPSDQRGILTSLLFGLRTRGGSTGGALVLAMPGEHSATIPRDTAVLGLVLDARVDRSAGAPADQRTVLQLINDTASPAGQPTQVTTIEGVDVREAPAR